MHDLVKREPRSPPPFVKSEPVDGRVGVHEFLRTNVPTVLIILAASHNAEEGKREYESLSCVGIEQWP